MGLLMKSDDKLVSVIIPAYNVEKYISECLDSIILQTYKNIEIIVVNDGSKDNTLNIIQDYSKKDKRIIILEKQNTGVSDSRNCGLDRAKGDYVVFVDGDDFLANDYISYMLSLIGENDKDFAFSLNCYTKRNEKQEKTLINKSLTSEEATAILLSPRVMVGCWNKIYKREFLNRNNIRFVPKLRYGEGLQFITHVTLFTNKIVCGNKKVYYYRRNNAESVCTRFNIENVYNGELSLEVIKKSLPTDSDLIKTMFELHHKMYCLGALVKVKSNGLEEKYSYDCKRWFKNIKSNILKFILKPYIPVYRKLLLLSSCLFPNLITKLYAWRQKRIFNNSIQTEK